MTFRDYPCPCCGFPTLSERCAYEICSICWWEDDGQDDETADAVWSGPNKDYSLTEARKNFRACGTMYRAGDTPAHLKRPSAARTALLGYVEDVLSNRKPLDEDILDALLLKASPRTSSN